MTKLIEPYNPNWQTAFEDIKQVIEVALHELNTQIEIQHIGSTSIQGMYAKPILDIDIILHEKSSLEQVTIKLTKIGYISRGEQGVAGRFAFRQKSEKVPLTQPNKKWLSHHLYVCYADSLALKNHLLFRDALRNDKDLAQQYSEIKKSLTDNSKIIREDYSSKKTDFIISVLTKAGLSKKELKEITEVNTTS
jgi:GrpB-like predicted nucleotidyltransferase (UPF0157 family)